MIPALFEAPGNAVLAVRDRARIVVGLAGLGCVLLAEFAAYLILNAPVT